MNFQTLPDTSNQSNPNNDELRTGTFQGLWCEMTGSFGLWCLGCLLCDTLNTHLFGTPCEGMVFFVQDGKNGLPAADVVTERVHPPKRLEWNHRFG